jgi:hypothetical protein
MIRLHCRTLRKHDIPLDFQSAIYDNERIDASELVYEVDVDYFRSVDWPLGTAVVEFSSRLVKKEALVRMDVAHHHDQPGMHDVASFRRSAAPDVATKANTFMGASHSNNAASGNFVSQASFTPSSNTAKLGMVF